MPRGRRLKPLTDANVGEEVGNADADDTYRNEVCKAIDREVEARARAIMEICEAQTSTLLMQLDLEQSKFSDEMLDMPLEDFVKLYCPSTEVKEERGSTELKRKRKNIDFSFLPPNASEAVKELFMKSVGSDLGDKKQKAPSEIPNKPTFDSTLQTPQFQHQQYNSKGGDVVNDSFSKYQPSPRRLRSHTKLTTLPR